MRYLALYRKYRPENFSDVKGQDAVVTTLRNEVLTGRIGHAYLFSGPRGTGKTSVAKIMARAANCTSLDGIGTTCGKCESCIKSADGTNTDIIEIDAASNNGIDNIRSLIDEARYVPQYGMYKVYIIDEVHMLSQSAFNALLKTIEEPPDNVIFILATTELHKVPATISSRCQQFQFKLLPDDLLVQCMKGIVDAENVSGDGTGVPYNISDDSFMHIAKLSGGSFRDALSLLDQCMAYCKDITLKHVKEVFGELDCNVIDEMCGYIENKQVSRLFTCIDGQIMDGRSISSICGSLYEHYKELYLVAENEQYERYMRILGDMSGQIGYATSSSRTLFEIGMIRLCKPQMETDTTSLSLRIQDLEDEIEQLKQNGITVKETEPEDMTGLIQFVIPKRPAVIMEVV